MPLEPTVRLETRLAYNDEETADLLGITPSTLVGETAAGRIRKNGNGLYSKAEVERYLYATIIAREIQENAVV